MLNVSCQLQGLAFVIYIAIRYKVFFLNVKDHNILKVQFFNIFISFINLP